MEVYFRSYGRETLEQTGVGLDEVSLSTGGFHSVAVGQFSAPVSGVKVGFRLFPEQMFSELL